MNNQGLAPAATPGAYPQTAVRAPAWPPGAKQLKREFAPMNGGTANEGATWQCEPSQPYCWRLVVWPDQHGQVTRSGWKPNASTIAADGPTTPSSSIR